MEEFSCRTRILAGQGACRALADFGARRLFLVTEPRLYRSGAAARAAALAGAQTLRIWDGAEPDPDLTRGTAALRAFRPELIAALGSGAALDRAKAMAYFARTAVPLVVIPTSFGPGSEVTGTADLGDTVLSDPILRPTAAILDSDLLRELPGGSIADGGFEVLANAAEAWAARGAGGFAQVWAREAFCIAFAALPAAYAGDHTLLQRLPAASAMAGLAGDHTGLGLCHALSRCLGGRFSVPRGRLKAILLPAVIACNAHAAADRYARLARAAGLGGSTEAAALRSLRSGLLRIRRELELPQTLAQAGIAPTALWSAMPGIVAAVRQDPCCAANPMAVEDFLIRRVLQQAAGRL